MKEATDSTSVFDSILVESNGFEMNEKDKRKQEKKEMTLNSHLTVMEREVYSAIRLCDIDKLKSLGLHEQIDPNFKIELQ